MKNLIKQILQEEFDDLEWIHEVNPKKYQPQNGDHIRVHYYGDRNYFLNLLGWYADKYEEGNYGEYIEGVVINNKNSDYFSDDPYFWLKEYNTGDLIALPTIQRMDGLNSSFDWGYSDRLRIIYEKIK